MKAEELKKIAKRYAQDELKDNHSAVEDVVAAAFLNGIDYAEHHPQWISVEDGLPKESGGFYLSVDSDGEIWFRQFTKLYGWRSTIGNMLISGIEVTHWMPMPAPPKEETKWTEHTLQRDKDGFLVGEVSDLDVYLPFEAHDNKHDTWEVIEDDSALVDWSGDIDTKPRYDRIRTIRQVVSKTENTKQKGGEQ